jgi:hypothetical protein
LIPYQLVDKVFREKLSRIFQVYLLFKHYCDGKIRLNKEVLSELAESLSVSLKTIRRAIKRLRARNWIGYNPKTGITYVRGFDSLRIIEDCPSRQSVWFNIDHVQDFKAWAGAVVISWLIRKQRAKKYEELTGVQTKGGTIQPVNLPHYFPIACNAIAYYFSVSKTKAHHTKQNAFEKEFIDIQKDTTILSIDNLQNYLKGFRNTKTGSLKRMISFSSETLIR